MTHGLLETRATLGPAHPERVRRGASTTERREWARVSAQLPIRATEGELEAFAASDPSGFLELLVSGRLEPADLTFAAEIAGTIEPTIEVVPFLLRLLEDEHAVVREGAVYGLLPHLERSRQAREALRRHQSSGYEPSPGVRAATTDALQQVRAE